jgi:hypothetical protein
VATKTYNVLSRVRYAKADETGKIIVKEKTYEAGSPIDLDDEDAKPLLDAKAIELPAKAK